MAGVKIPCSQWQIPTNVRPLVLRDPAPTYPVICMFNSSPILIGSSISPTKTPLVAAKIVIMPAVATVFFSGVNKIVSTVVLDEICITWRTAAPSPPPNC